MKLLTYTCQACSAQHDSPGPSVKGSIQPGQLKHCKPCKATTFHFAALSDLKPSQELELTKGRRK